LLGKQETGLKYPAKRKAVEKEGVWVGVGDIDTMAVYERQCEKAVGRNFGRGNI